MALHELWNRRKCGSPPYLQLSFLTVTFFLGPLVSAPLEAQWPVSASEQRKQWVNQGEPWPSACTSFTSSRSSKCWCLSLYVLWCYGPRSVTLWTPDRTFLKLRAWWVMSERYLAWRTVKMKRTSNQLRQFPWWSHFRGTAQLCLHTCVSDGAFLSFLTSYICFGAADLVLFLAILQLDAFPMKQIQPVAVSSSGWRSD